MKPTIDLENTEQQLIVAAVLTMFDQGKNVHEVMAMSQEIIKQVWYAVITESK